MSIEIQVAYDTQKLKGYLFGIPSKVIQPALARTLNRSIITVRKEANADVRENLKLKSGIVTKALPITHKASPREDIQRQFSELKVSSKPQSLYNFGATQTASGVSVNVKGKRKIIKHAFIATLGKGGNGGGGEGSKGVFLRANIIKPGTKMRRTGVNRSQLPIVKLYSTKVSDVFGDRKGRYKVTAQATVQKEFKANFKYYLNEYEK